MNRLLLVEDDELVGDGLRLLLIQAGYTVDWVTDVSAAEQSLSEPRYSAVVLDLNLPGGSGIDILRRLRARCDGTPVIIVTARDKLCDRVEALNIGADDYIVKPIDIGELVARLNAVLRRVHGRADEILRSGDVVLDPLAYVVTHCGQPVPLSKREYTVLKLLMEIPGKVVTRQRLEEELYVGDSTITSNAIEVFVHNLRKKINPHFIQTVRGIGYKVDGLPS